MKTPNTFTPQTGDSTALKQDAPTSIEEDNCLGIFRPWEYPSPTLPPIRKLLASREVLAFASHPLFCIIDGREVSALPQAQFMTPAQVQFVAPPHVPAPIAFNGYFGSVAIQR